VRGKFLGQFSFLIPDGSGKTSRGKPLFASLLYFDQEFARLQGFNQGWRLSSNMARAMDEPKARGGNKLNSKSKSIKIKK
jgi:hypothetical protein